MKIFVQRIPSHWLVYATITDGAVVESPLDGYWLPYMSHTIPDASSPLAAAAMCPILRGLENYSFNHYDTLDTMCVVII